MELQLHIINAYESTNKLYEPSSNSSASVTTSVSDSMVCQ